MNITITAWRDLAHPNAGGSERYVDDIATGLLARGHQVTLLAGGPVAERVYPVIDTGSTYGQYVRAPLVHLRHLRAADLVVDIQNGMPFWSPLWRRGPKLCVVHHVHTDQWRTRFPAAIARVGETIEQRAFPLAYRHTPFVAVSPSTGKALESIGVDPSRVSIVPNAVRPMADPLPEAPEPTFIILGRLVPHKRVDLALQLWEKVRPLTGGRLIVVGEGPERTALQAMAGADVEFRGSVDEAEKHRLLSEAWLLIHPAMHEGWGIVITEAARQRTSAIGFDVPGVRDSVRPGETGVLVTQPDELAAAWVELAGDEARRRELGEAARRRSMDYTPERTITLFEQACLEAVAGSRAEPDGS